MSAVVLILFVLSAVPLCRRQHHESGVVIQVQLLDRGHDHLVSGRLRASSGARSPTAPPRVDADGDPDQDDDDQDPGADAEEGQCPGVQVQGLHRVIWNKGK